MDLISRFPRTFSLHLTRAVTTHPYYLNTNRSYWLLYSTYIDYVFNIWCSSKFRMTVKEKRNINVVIKEEKKKVFHLVFSRRKIAKWGPVSNKHVFCQGKLPFSRYFYAFPTKSITISRVCSSSFKLRYFKSTLLLKINQGVGQVANQYGV